VLAGRLGMEMLTLHAASSTHRTMVTIGVNKTCVLSILSGVYMIVSPTFFQEPLLA